MNKKIVFLPYDFDTAIGINNEGSLVFGYDLEDIDHTESNADIFNGQQSVLWVNLRSQFFDELRTMYQQLRSTGVLSYDVIENAFEAHQGKWPEAIFNEDSWYKYLAPLEEKGSAAYLAMLQGSKASQRKWWLYNRFRYMDSKYNAGDSLTDVITLRGYAKSNITITPYADIYASIKFGSYLVQTRATRGQSYTMVCPLDNVNDTEIYIYSASQLASVGDLSGLAVGYAEFVYATKLQSLVLGNSSPYYSNANLQTLYVGNCPLLRTVDVRNCSGLGTGDQKTVDLSGCTGLQEAYFTGTSITGVTLPVGGVLTTLHLPSTITSLIVRSQPNLTSLVCSSFAGVTTLWLENVGSVVDTLAILSVLPTGARVRIFGFSWSVQTVSTIADMLDTLDDMRGLDQTGATVSTAQVYGSIYVPSVTGAVIAHVHESYPDITITYDHVTATLTYRDNDGTLLASETITDGGTPAYTPTLTTKDEGSYHYTFLGWSTEQNGSVESDCLQNVISDTTVYAIYSATVRTYTVRLYNGSTLLQTYTNVTYGSTIIPGITPTYAGAGNPSDYQFTGWSPAPENVMGDLDCYAQYTFIGVVFRDYISGTMTSFTDESALTAIGAYAFAGMSSLTSVSMPSLQSVPEYGFVDLPALESVSLPAVLAVNAYSFYQLSSLTLLTLPELTIMNGAFNFVQLSALTELRLPKNTVTLQQKCSYLTSLELLDVGVTTTFGQTMSATAWSKMETLILRCTSQVVTLPSTTCFGSTSPLGRGTGRVLVPQTLVDTYKADSTWANYVNEIFAIEDYDV